ncbi:Uncharacterised protein [Vibrio cholerae]|nr:Uncharacterised protein [Vibrio cholerae]
MAEVSRAPLYDNQRFAQAHRALVRLMVAVRCHPEYTDPLC